MQLIKDLSDVQRFSTLLEPFYQTKLVADINELLIKYMAEQAQNQQPVNNSPQPAAPIVPPVINNIQAPPNNFRPPMPASVNPAPPSAPLFKPLPGKGINVPPPPPPPANMPPLGSNNMAFKPMSLGGQKPMGQKIARTSFISIFESLGYVIPDLNTKGKNALENLPSTSEVFKYIKQIDGSTNLKQIYMMVYPSTVSPVNFIEKTMMINEQNLFDFSGTGTFPKDADASIRLGEMLVALGYIDQDKIEQALLHQRREVKVVFDDEVSHYDAAEARKEENKNLKREKPLLGDILVDMKYVSYQQVVHALKIQKWYRDLLESTR